MKQFLTYLITVASFLLLSCSNGGGNTKGTASEKKSNQSDTGYTGIEVYKRDGVVMKEVNYKNGIKDGLTKVYYNAATVREEIPYVNGKKNGISKWYYEDRNLFRTTPYENDTINGEQMQYYKNGKIRARIKYVDGKRVPAIDEYQNDGTKIVNYPKLVYRINDNYSEKGTIKILVELSDHSEEAKFYRGEYVNGLVDLNDCTPLLQTATTGYVDLKKTAGASTDSVHVICGYLTPLGNRYYMHIAIPVPYKDLK